MPGPDTRAALDHHARGEGYEVTLVPLGAREQKDFYEGTCNRVLWPLLHGLYEHGRPRTGDHQIYADVNRLFARVAAADRPETVWVHDYHLLLAGERLRRLLPTARLGFFLHVPFPGAEAMLRLGWGEQLVRSLAAFDLIGFQTEGDRRRFVEWARHVRASTSSTGRALPCVPPSLEAAARVFPISIDWRRYHDEADDSAVRARAGALRAEAGGRQILLGVDRLDYTKGIPHRLRGYAHLLEVQPELRGRVEFVQLAVPSRTAIPEYQHVREEVEASVRAVNERFRTPGWTPVRYEYGMWDHAELLARYQAADVAVVTSLRDGMNLVAKEFCAASRGRGVLVLSRHAGAAEELRHEVVLVDPFDPKDVAEALRSALAMAPAERTERLARAQAHLRTHDVHRWSASFLDRLERAPRRERPSHVWAAARRARSLRAR